MIIYCLFNSLSTFCEVFLAKQMASNLKIDNENNLQAKVLYAEYKGQNEKLAGVKDFKYLKSSNHKSSRIRKLSQHISFLNASASPIQTQILQDDRSEMDLSSRNDSESLLDSAIEIENDNKYHQIKQGSIYDRKSTIR